MKKAPIPEHDADRVTALQKTGLLDTAPEERFDRYTRLVQRLFDAPIALVSLVDESRQWFKSRQGLDATETPRDVSFCGHAIQDDDVFVVNDALEDERFADNPLVIGAPGVRFYAGCPLINEDGYRLGTICVIDTKSRELNDRDTQTLADIAALVAGEMTTQQLATMDPLTGLSNRRAFNAIADQALAMCARSSESATLLIIDLDGFKEINDKLGHAAGDDALKTFSGLLLESFRDSDVVARLGGDEFCVLFTSTTMEQSWQCVERFRDRLGARNRSADSDYKLRFSAGVVQYDADRHSAVSDLLDEADQLMYRRKRAKPKLAAV
ncbi:MAG: sensor domain-containing diguanylate cyclase [Gammaproteobacteria bacterium]|nr:sensor domain-containing diguanylate cyclase [Gammaproteobacteria bacterium]